jgi:hypothetical protein
MLKELPKDGPVTPMYTFNATLRLEYWPKSLKTAQIIMIPKPGKNPTDVSSYRPISLLSTISKVLEKLILKKSIKNLTQRLDPKPLIWVPTGSLHNATMPPHNRRLQYSHRKPTVSLHF